MTYIDTHWPGESRRNPTAEVELPPRARGTTASEREPAAQIQGRQPISLIALLVAVVAAVLAVVAIAGDDVASTPAPIPTEVVEDNGPPTAQPAGVPDAVPDGVPCPVSPARGMVPC